MLPVYVQAAKASIFPGKNVVWWIMETGADEDDLQVLHSFYFIFMHRRPAAIIQK